MIIRILTEGQYDVPDSEMDGLNVLDEKLEQAIESNDESQFAAALAELLGRVRAVGTVPPADLLVQSDLVLPYSDATLHEVRDLLSDEGLIPGRSGGSTSADA
jgi:PspAA-like protein